MNLAKSYLKRAYPDLTTGPLLDQAESAGLLQASAVLLRVLQDQGRDFSVPGSTVVEVARQLERQQLSRFQGWRDDLCAKVKDESLRNVEIMFAELSSPQAVTIHEQDHSYAIGMDRGLLTFLASVTGWAYISAGLESHGLEPMEAHSALLLALSEHVQLSYLKRALPYSFEQRELEMMNHLGELDWQMVGAAAHLAAKFVLYHELAHVHLKHFETNEGRRLNESESGQISAFHEQELEFEADRFAAEHLMDLNGGLTQAVVSKLAPAIFFYVLELKEALAPTPAYASETMLRVHPQSLERAERLSLGERPPAFLPQWGIMFRIPELLRFILESEGFQAAAQFFRKSTADGVLQ